MPKKSTPDCSANTPSSTTLRIVWACDSGVPSAALSRSPNVSSPKAYVSVIAGSSLPRVPPARIRATSAPGRTPGHDLAAAPAIGAAVLERGQHAVAGGPVVHRVDHDLAGEPPGVELGEPVQRYREHHDVRVRYRVAGPPRPRAGNDQLSDQRDV